MSETNPQDPPPTRASDEKLVADYRYAAGQLGRAGGGLPPAIAAAMARLKANQYASGPPVKDSHLVRLSNAEARPIAEAIYQDLAKRYHPSALLKLVGLLDRIHARETKSQQVAWQTGQAKQGDE